MSIKRAVDPYNKPDSNGCASGRCEIETSVNIIACGVLKMLQAVFLCVMVGVFEASAVADVPVVPNSCRATICPRNQRCVMEKVICKTSPCRPRPRCVPVSLSCYYNGQRYPAGDFRLPGNPCAFCQCDGSTGQASCAFMKCARPACDNPIFVKEECCPLCPGPGEVCYFGGRFYPVGPFRDLASPCDHCTCHSDGQVTCAIQDCARPPCEEPVSVPGQCCPYCPPPTQGPWDCSTVRCAKPLCPNHVTLAGQCCPTCPIDLDAELA